jgi:tetratricopeptide (TPR) repeat protein
VSTRLFWTVAWLAVALWARPPATVHALTYAQQLAQLAQANRAFEQALTSTTPEAAQGYYRQAIAGYEQLIAAGIHNAKLYYNLGNAYFRLNDLGHAILHYRRGLRLEPGNRQLQANLRYARSRRIDQIDVSRERQHALLPQLFFWSDALSIPTQGTLALVGYYLAWGCAFAHLVWRRASLLWGLAGAAFFCLVFAGSTWLTQLQYAARQAGVIVAEEVVMRKGNGESYTPQLPQPLHAGTEFVVLEARGSWLAIQLDNGTSGWIRRDSAALL